MKKILNYYSAFSDEDKKSGELLVCWCNTNLLTSPTWMVCSKPPTTRTIFGYFATEDDAVLFATAYEAKPVPHKPCPFCGSTDLDNDAIYISCNVCSSYGPSSTDEKSAWDLWDERPGSPS